MYFQCCVKEDDNISIKIYDLIGKLVYNYSKDNVGANKIAINTKNILPGNYFLQLRINDTFRVRKITITE